MHKVCPCERVGCGAVIHGIAMRCLVRAHAAAGPQRRPPSPSDHQLLFFFFFLFVNLSSLSPILLQIWHRFCFPFSLLRLLPRCLRAPDRKADREFASGACRCKLCCTGLAGDDTYRALLSKHPQPVIQSRSSSLHRGAINSFI